MTAMGEVHDFTMGMVKVFLRVTFGRVLQTTFESIINNHVTYYLQRNTWGDLYISKYIPRTI